MSQFARRTSSQHSSSRQSQPEASTSRGRARAVVEESDDEDGGSGGRGGRGGREQPTLETRLNELSVPIPKPQMDEEFRHRPLDKDTSAQRIVMLCKEWHIVVKELEESMNVLGTAAADLQEAIADDDEEDEEAAEEIKRADADFRILIDRHYEATTRKETLDGIRQRLNLSHQITKPLEEYESTVEEKLGAWKAKTARQKYVSNERYILFRTGLWESSGESGGMPPMRRFVAREDQDPESDEEEIEVNVVQSFKDPITTTWLEKPVRNPACKHIFSRGSITQHIRSAPGRKEAQCPIPGCPKTIRLDSLQDDPQLERRVQQARRREEESGRNTQGVYQTLEDDDDEDEDEEVENDTEQANEGAAAAAAAGSEEAGEEAAEEEG